MILAALYSALFPCRVLGHRGLVEAAVPSSLSQLAFFTKDRVRDECGQFIQGNDQLSSRVQPGLDLQGNGKSYTLVRCLGAGAYGEAWLVQLPGGREAVMKLLQNVLFENENASVAEAECNFATRAIERVGSVGDVHITACLDSGKLDPGPAEAGGASPRQVWSYVVFERADGDELGHLLSESAPAILPEVLPSVGKVFLRLKQLHDFMDALSFGDAGGLRLFHHDLHPANLFITKDYLTAIDYGETHVCCGTAACASRLSIARCEGKRLEQSLAGNEFFLAVDTIAFLVEKPPETKLKDAVMNFAVDRVKESSGGADFQERVRKEFREECHRDSDCDQALHSAAQVLRRQAPAVGALTLSEIIERGST